MKVIFYCLLYLIKAIFKLLLIFNKIIIYLVEFTSLQKDNNTLYKQAINAMYKYAINAIYKYITNTIYKNAIRLSNSEVLYRLLIDETLMKIDGNRLLGKEYRLLLRQYL